MKRLQEGQALTPATHAVQTWDFVSSASSELIVDLPSSLRSEGTDLYLRHRVGDLFECSLTASIPVALRAATLRAT